jgi:lysophospholipase L1-like esterase
MLKYLLAVSLTLTSLFAQAQKYVALGDSVPFGATPYVQNFRDAHSYRGYPEIISLAMKWQPINAACPGQTSEGFFNRGAKDLACFKNLKSGINLKVDWRADTQEDFALDYLQTNSSQTKLVTLQLGANDLVENLFKCESVYEGCTPDERYNKIPVTLWKIKKNLRRILRKLRTVYKGPLIIINYYSPNYQNMVTTTGIKALNAILKIEASRAGVNAKVADVFSAFKTRAAHFKGNLCSTGLLTKNPDCNKWKKNDPSFPRDYCASGLRVDPQEVPCDSHPSILGQSLIAQVILKELHEGTGKKRKNHE